MLKKASCEPEPKPRKLKLLFCENIALIKLEKSTKKTAICAKERGKEIWPLDKEKARIASNAIKLPQIIKICLLNSSISGVPGKKNSGVKNTVAIISPIGKRSSILFVIKHYILIIFQSILL